MPNLWTSYAPDREEVISALATSTTSKKEEPHSPAPTPPPPTSQAPAVPYGYYIPATLEPTLQPMEYYYMQMAFQYGHQQTSPSTISCYDESGSDSESVIYDLDNNPEYIVFERDALQVMAERNGGTLAGSNPRTWSVGSSSEDGSYPQQCESHNATDKQSRDRRKLREVKLGLKVTFLERQNRKLQAMLASSQMCFECFPHHDF